VPSYAQRVSRKRGFHGESCVIDALNIYISFAFWKAAYAALGALTRGEKRMLHGTIYEGGRIGCGLSNV
jgi:hypothetical protein